MKCRYRPLAFSLIEILIVVIILAMLAVTIVPQFSQSNDDTKKSVVEFNVHSIRAQIELYNINHGSYPTIDKLTDQLTKKTDKDGTVNASAGIYGPYIKGNFPMNPYTNTRTIKPFSGEKASAADVGGTEGWMYNPANGAFYPNNLDFFR
jgi:general secretion pathway protein G